MAFHFPLMPRIYMAVAQEDRHPIIDIMRQTPDIPANCQWATFLRNHDELTLEMVTDRERDYMWDFYAADRRARINFGIRRRLAPLMGNDRRKLELMNALLMSLMGTPILYYGDEIGMGDNFFLGDRNSVRTPMQWSPDRNGGFSQADPNYLYLPALMDPIYGYQAVNVEAQRRSATSLLNWTRQLINVVKQHRAFGRGSVRFYQPANRKVLAYLRSHGDETVLCVANLSPSAQPVELGLQEFKGRVPVELMGRSRFPMIGDLPYFLTLPPYGFFWFLLAEAPAVEPPIGQTSPDLLTLVAPEGWSSLAKPPARGLLEGQLLPQFLLAQRWFGAKDAGTPKIEIVQTVNLGRDQVLALLRVTPPEHAPYLQLIGTAIAWEDKDDPVERLFSTALARVRKGARVGVLYESSSDPEFVRALVAGFTEGATRPAELPNALIVTPTASFPGFDPASEMRPLGAEQSNSSSLVGDTAIFKMIRKPEVGRHPEAEISRFLTETSPFANTPSLFGTLELKTGDDTSITIGILQGLIQNQGDGWKVTLDYLDRFFADYRAMAAEDLARETVVDRHADYIELARRLGVRTAELHRAFAADTRDAAFEPEPVSRNRRSMNRFARKRRTCCRTRAS